MRADFMPSIAKHPEVALPLAVLLTGYGELELGFALLVAAVMGDRDAAFKALFRVRGELSRLQIGDALVRHLFPSRELQEAYAYAFTGLDRCRVIRNRYAHSQWVEGGGGVVRFVALEDATKGTGPVDLGLAKPRLLTAEVLEEQVSYFAHIRNWVSYLTMEVLWIGGANSGNPLPRPPPQEFPPNWAQE